GHHSGVAVLRGIGDQRETADHVAAHDIVERSARCARTLPGEDLVVVAVVRDALLAGVISFRRGVSGKLAEWALVLAGLRRPVEAVLLAGATDDALRIDAVAAKSLLGVFLLGVDVGEDGLDRPELVAANAAIENLVATGGGVELPAAVRAHQRDREW